MEQSWYVPSTTLGSLATNLLTQFHESITDYYTLRDLQKAIRRPFNFWTFSLAKPLENADRPVHFQRIFPQGAVILLTEEFMKREPDATIITLAWFNDFIKRKLSGSWKIMLRPSVLSWLAKWLENENDGVMTGK
jgi:chromo domain-containing protein 1